MLNSSQRIIVALTFVYYGYLSLISFASSSRDIEEGKMCDPREFYEEVVDEPKAYYQCTPKVKQVGQWEKLKCPGKKVFSKQLQKCTKKEKIRRQYVQPLTGCASPNCNSNQPVYGAQPVVSCAATNANPYVGSPCSWTTASLYPSQQPSNFLQCTPTTQGAACGTWQQMACAGGTQYNPQLQVCVTSALQGTCTQPQYSAVCGCNAQYSCPQTCQCQMGTCCQPPVVVTPAPPVLPQLPMCPNTNTPAISMCTTDSQCPPGYSCQVGGCCLRPLPICGNGQQAIATCVGAGQSTCPIDYSCQNGGCCVAPLPVCPTGVTASSRCGTNGAVCPAPLLCVNGGCCAINCNNGQPAAAICVGVGQSNCQTGFYCQNSACCRLPLCPNGQPAQAVCTNGGICPGNLVCNNGGCCPPPLPTCPNNGPATIACAGPGTCPTGAYCFQQGIAQGCCPIPTCSNGNPAIQPCGTPQFPSCPTNFQCQNGGCCPIPLPTCPNIPTVPATTPCTTSCPSSAEFCYTDAAGVSGCCPIPICQDGTQALQPCFANPGSCPGGYECQNGGCCRLPTCPNGQPSNQRCTGPNDCPLGQSCQNGACCPVQCPNGGNPVQICGISSACPAGFNCFMSQCCPAPPPTCPNGQLASQLCVGAGQSNCPIGYTCQNGGCCITMVAPARPVCAAVAQPLCYCAAYNNACPYRSQCNSGTCCAGAASPMYNTVRPGDRCSAQTQCPGLSTCTSGYCVCSGNSRSNGVTCLAYNRMKKRMRDYNPAEQCTQFGTECRKYESAVRIVRDADGTVRRKEPTAKDIGIEKNTEPLFWTPISEGYCNRSNDCTPDMTCIDSKCHPLMLVGDIGCVYDEQCNKTASGAKCLSQKMGSKDTKACACEEGKKEYDRKCWKDCPAETSKKEGNKCVKIRMDKTTYSAFAKRILSLFSNKQNQKMNKSSKDERLEGRKGTTNDWLLLNK